MFLSDGSLISWREVIDRKVILGMLFVRGDIVTLSSQLTSQMIPSNVEEEERGGNDKRQERQTTDEIPNKEEGVSFSAWRLFVGYPDLFMNMTIIYLFNDYTDTLLKLMVIE